MFRESEKSLNKTPRVSFFVNLVHSPRKRVKLILDKHSFKSFNERERQEVCSTIFSYLGV